MLRHLLAQVAVILAATTLGGWVYVNYFYKGGRRKPAYKPKHDASPGRVPIVWIDWEEKFGDRILTFGAAL